MVDHVPHRLEEEVARGNDARRILEHPLWQEAFDTYEARLLAGWSSSGVHDVDAREKIWLALQTVKIIKHDLESIMTTGKMATLQMERSENGRKASKH